MSEEKKPPQITHELYTGVTQSGKTTLARAVSRALDEKGARIAVLDPMLTLTAGGGWGKNALVFDDTEKFLDFVHSEECVNTHLFIDEAHNIFKHTELENMWLLTEGRHYWLTLHLMTQRPKKIHPDARTNCGRCYMFRLAQDDAKEIGADFGFSDVHKQELDRGDFLILNSGSAEYSRANVFKLLE